MNVYGRRGALQESERLGAMCSTRGAMRGLQRGLKTQLKRTRWARPRGDCVLSGPISDATYQRQYASSFVCANRLEVKL